VKPYWDSSALIEACQNQVLRARLHREGGLTRTHPLAETFSTLIGGNLAFRVDADAAAQVIPGLARELTFHDLSPAEVLTALRAARKKGVRDGRVHDYLHALAAEKTGATKLLTLD
jgi:hypothetical protein